MPLVPLSLLRTSLSCTGLSFLKSQTTTCTLYSRTNSTWSVSGRHQQHVCLPRYSVSQKTARKRQGMLNRLNMGLPHWPLLHLLQHPVRTDRVLQHSRGTGRSVFTNFYTKGHLLQQSLVTNGIGSVWPNYGGRGQFKTLVSLSAISFKPLFFKRLNSLKAEGFKMTANLYLAVTSRKLR